MPITNSQISHELGLTAKLLELHQGNEFKIKAYQAASFRIDRLQVELHTLSSDERRGLDGLGKSIQGKLDELINDGKLAELNSLLQATPAGVLDLLKIKGLGPKKVRTIWKELEVETLGELQYACLENRLVTLNGFGPKTQAQVLKSIEFMQHNSCKLRMDEALMLASSFITFLNNEENIATLTGQCIRQCEIVDKIEIVLSKRLHLETNEKWLDFGLIYEKSTDSEMHFVHSHSQLHVIIHFVTELLYARKVFELSCTEHFLSAIAFDKAENFTSESDFFASRKLPFVLPEMRENNETLQLAIRTHPSELIKQSDIKGCVHTHSVWSDGSNTIEQMAEACIQAGLSYLVISDHSKSAFYAGGLTIEKVVEQHAEIDALNKKYTQQNIPFKVFKSIESDILNDGSLDYEVDLLKTFDLVIASVHSNLKMDEEKAMARLLKAIENPFTRILGHPTGRLLLSRPGYPLDMKIIADACAANGVTIELNANPYRLDIDWRHLPLFTERNVMVSINPDAHEIAGIADIAYGVAVARKGGLLSKQTLNTKTLDEFEAWVKRRNN